MMSEDMMFNRECVCACVCAYSACVSMHLPRFYVEHKERVVMWSVIAQ